MCGITGIIHTDGRPVAREWLQRMTRALSHRGPDGEGVWHDGAVGLGHRRLAIIDLSERGQQPMQARPDGPIITYSGEVYNYEQLRTELQARGRSFRTRTDTEVVLAAYDEWGAECVHRFNGMFAFAIWDVARHRLFLARDRYGIKPLYYYHRDGVFLFGSEVKAFLAHPSFETRVLPEALNEYFSFQNLFGDHTLFADVRMLPGGHTLTVSTTGSLCNPHRYWDFDFREDNTIGEEDGAAELERLFEQAVSRQLVSDVEIGAYLSGGIDSGAVTSVAAKQFRNLKTFTGGFDLSSASGLELGFDERSRAEHLSNLYKTEHYEVVLKAGDMERVMPELVWHLEDLRIGQSYPNYYVARLASKFVRVVLSGAGGDELFAGYPWRYYRAVVNETNADYLRKYYVYWQRLIPDELKPRFFREQTVAALNGHTSLAAFERVMANRDDGAPGAAEYVNRSLYFEAKTFLHGVLLVEDKLSMAHGLETRVPFLDNDLVDFACRVPIRYKLRNLGEVARLNENEPGAKTQKYFNQTGDGKLILRRALRRYVPEAYSHAPKQGFSAPDASWFKGESIDYIRSLLCQPRAYIYDYLDSATVQGLLDQHFKGTVNHRLLIWSLLCFEWWLKVFVHGEHARETVTS